MLREEDAAQGGEGMAMGAALPHIELGVMKSRLPRNVLLGPTSVVAETNAIEVESGTVGEWEGDSLLTHTADDDSEDEVLIGAEGVKADDVEMSVSAVEGVEGMALETPELSTVRLEQDQYSNNDTPVLGEHAPIADTFRLVVQRAMRRAGAAMLVTSFTTAAAFYSSTGALSLALCTHMKSRI
jgi:hypothetical protein